MPSFPGVDFLDFDSLLSDDEKLPVNGAFNLRRPRFSPSSSSAIARGNPDAARAANGRAGFFGANLNGYGPARHVQRESDS